MRLDRAQKIAQEIIKMLEDYCIRVEIGGSIRRKKAEVKDIEIVYISKMVPLQVAMFDEEDTMSPVMDGRVMSLVQDGVLQWDRITFRNGPKYKRLIHVESGMVVELFRATEKNWGAIYALRTGDAGFSKLLVTATWSGGAMPAGMRMQHGHLWRMGFPLESHTETEFFSQLRLPWIKPENRNAETLRRYLKHNVTRVVPAVLGFGGHGVKAHGSGC